MGFREAKDAVPGLVNIKDLALSKDGRNIVMLGLDATGKSIWLRKATVPSAKIEVVRREESYWSPMEIVAVRNGGIWVYGSLRGHGVPEQGRLLDQAGQEHGALYKGIFELEMPG